LYHFEINSYKKHQDNGILLKTLICGSDM